MKKLIFILTVSAALTACGQNVPVDSGEPAAKPAEQTEQTTQAAAEEQTAAESADEGNVSKDITLRTDKKEIVVGEDDGEVIFYAEIPAACTPEKLELFDAGSGEKVGELFDEADFEKYGDTIKGDSVYNCRFKVNTDINKDPDVSAMEKYHYYAQFEDKDGIHRSEAAEITVLEQFTDKELEDMEEVDKVLAGMTNSDEYKAMTKEQKAERAVETLTVLAESGTSERPYSLVKKGSIAESDSVVGFEYACGVCGGVMTEDFKDGMN